MKLSRLYCNLPSTFGPISFNGVGDDLLSVVFARITKPKDSRKDSHNLGKTSLIHLLDFLLLKEVNDKNSFLLKHLDRFEQFIFFLELKIHGGQFVTIRRSVDKQTRIWLKKHDRGGLDLTVSGDADWDHADVPLENARKLLDGYLNLTVIQPWDYRKGVSYFLRTQADYQDYFQISKFLKGQDSQWKPYLAHILGFNSELIASKYEIDAQIDDLENKRAERQAEVQVEEQEFSKLSVQLEIQKEEFARSAQLLDSFDFSAEERRVNRQLVDQVEQQVADLNSEIYKASYDLAEMQSSLEKGFTFRTDEVIQVFQETNTYVPSSLLKSYDELLGFNRRVTQERNRLLRRQIRDLEDELRRMDEERDSLNMRRVHLLETLRTADAFKKFKALQREHASQEAQIKYLEGQLERLSKVRELSRDLRDLQIRRDQIINELSRQVDSGSLIGNRVALEFHSLVKRVLDVDGEFYVKINKAGNIEFHIETKLRGKSRRVSSQSEGTSYKKLLCALFDIALLVVYADGPFYHFVYHDGIFEGIDTRKRRVLLEVLREISRKYHIQYILSTIDSDLPRDEKDAKIAFPVEEIIVELDDRGTKGRLFRMTEF